MRVVVADAGPIRYLVLIGHIEILPVLFGQVILPEVVQTELSSPAAPDAMRAWISKPPAWVEIAGAPAGAFAGLHKGEAATIALGLALRADLLLMDDRRGVREAKARGLRVTGTLGVLDLAAERGLIDFEASIHALGDTSFRKPLVLLNELLAKHRRLGSGQE